MPPKRHRDYAGFPDNADIPEAADGDSLHGKAKLARNPSTSDLRADATPEHFSAQVKNRLNQYTRTGQACDRCKVRKIKCDALPDGCSHCIQQNLECWVTDRVTGRTERRGYMRELERSKDQMEDHIRRLERLLGNNGIEVKPFSRTSNPSLEQDAPPSQGSGGGRAEAGSSSSSGSGQWTKVDGLWVKKQEGSPPSPGRRKSIRSGLESRPADRHLGVGPDHAPLSSINGTRLSVLGATIDITFTTDPDTEERMPDAAGSPGPLYNKSFQALFQSIMRVHPAPEIELPSRDVAFQCADWYFRLVFPFLPILHRPTFMAMLARIYDDPDFQPSAPDLAMAHTVMAIILYQRAARNGGPEFVGFNDQSNLHFHFALSKFFQLNTSQSIQAVQAMGLIAVHCRSFPKPGPCSFVSHYALIRALDLNLHRASNPPNGTTNLNLEIRRRTWWVILAVSITVNGRLGKPMPIALDDFDTEFPEPIADELLTEDGVDTTKTGQCTYECGIAALKISPLMLQMHSNLYGVTRDADNYSHLIHSLERQLRRWEDELPEDLKPRGAGLSGDDMGQVPTIYMELVGLDYRLSLRHPSVAMTSDPELCAENSRICEETAARMLKLNMMLVNLNSLDTTWYSMSVHVAAMFTMLVAHWERRSTVTNEEMQSLQQDIKDWLRVIWSSASLLSSEKQVFTQLEGIVNRTLHSIENARTWSKKKKVSKATSSKTPVATSAAGRSDLPGVSAAAPPQPPQPPPRSNNEAMYMPQTRGPVSLPSSGSTPSTRTTNEHVSYYNDSTSQHHAATASTPVYASMPTYSQPHNTSAFDSGSSYMYPQGGGGGPQTARSAAGPSTAVDPSQGHNNPMMDFATQAPQHVVEPSDPAAVAEADGYLWRQQQQQPSHQHQHQHHQHQHQQAEVSHQGTNWEEWATMLANQDHYGANTLMTMGRDPSVDVTAASLTADMTADMTGQQWPLLLWNGQDPSEEN